MADYTLGDFEDDIDELERKLKRILKNLERSDPDRTIDKNPGWNPICGFPVFMGPSCVKPEPPTGGLQVDDLVKAVDGMKEWASNVKSRVSKCDSGITLSSKTDPRSRDD